MFLNIVKEDARAMLSFDKFQLFTHLLAMLFRCIIKLAFILLSLK